MNTAISFLFIKRVYKFIIRRKLIIPCNIDAFLKQKANYIALKISFHLVTYLKFIDGFFV